jgi:glutamate-1-semialdehyde aminotransferase
MFAGAFHGQSDGVLAQSFGDDPTGQPVLFGILPATTHATLVFEPVAASLERIEAMRSDIAAVLIEPVFSRAPEAVTPEFLQQLRALTQKIDCALVFDEIVTGFRLGQRGAAGHFGVRPDMATLGKIIGGGIPIGVVAGSSRFMNGVDAGGYNFGDDSMPFAPPTYVAGTFSKNPLAMAAANAMLVEIEKRGPSLYQQLEAHAARLHAALRDACEGLETVRAQRRGTLVALVFSSEGAEFFERGMIHLGVFIKGGHFSLSAAHSEEDIDRAAQAARTTLAELRDAGIVS